MADSKPSPSPSPSPAPSGASPSGPSTKAPPAKPALGNPAFRAMGLPNFSLKLPSRNWMIFISITSTFTGFLLYDRHQKKQTQKKWCTLVSHLADEPLPVSSMPRKLTVYLCAPPGDGIRSAREHFNEYVKPILTAAALDWDMVEGRREGDIRSRLAEKVRKLRQRSGEARETPLEEDTEYVIEETRKKVGISEWDGVKGDVVVGRHTWKEYVRGLHEGWLGPLDPPPQPPQPSSADEALPAEGEPQPQTDLSESKADTHAPQTSMDDSAPPAASAAEPPAKPAETSKPSKPSIQPPYIQPGDYSASPLPPTIPQILGPSSPVQFPHILGILNTPTRIYRYLTQRYLADDVGRSTAAAVLAAYRPYHESDPSSEFSSDSVSPTSPSNSDPSSIDGTATSAQEWEQLHLFENEEPEWHKSVRKPRDDDAERTWLDDMVLDPRIAARMRRFELEAAEEARAQRILEGKEDVKGQNGNEPEAATEG
ncbi:MAG: hypothetical protein M1819_000232 [Sarea resinae]|nr:MAG: hypothetical protein M1819_000232 [Sarea resinae]